jgi:hypothetical protein
MRSVVRTYNFITLNLGLEWLSKPILWKQWFCSAIAIPFFTPSLTTDWEYVWQCIFAAALYMQRQLHDMSGDGAIATNIEHCFHPISQLRIIFPGERWKTLFTKINLRAAGNHYHNITQANLLVPARICKNARMPVFTHMGFVLKTSREISVPLLRS